MGYIVTIYSEIVYQEFLLPPINNADYSIVLPWNAFSLYEDVKIKMEVFNNKWRFVEGKGYSIQKEGAEYFRKDLKDQDAITLKLYNSLTFAILVQKREAQFTVYKKFLLPPKGNILIGKGIHNQICYDALGMVSSSHAAIDISQNRYVLRDMSKNGVYVNHIRMKQMHVLSFGDSINILGLKMVFLGSFLAIDTGVANLKISEEVLYPLEGGEIVDASLINAPEKKEFEEKKYFNRTPRSLEQMNPEPFIIEGPPGKDNTKRTPWYLTIGPSLTMAIPMTLGCVLSAVGNGSGSSVFMFTGLVTAFGSALIGTGWGAIRLKYEKKRRQDEEAYRLERYEKYLDDTEKEIELRYSEDIRILNERYPSAEIICAQNGNFKNLWNRNATHSDFLYLRLGMGTLPFPSEIRIPQKRFMLYEDELVQRPRDMKKKYENMDGVPIGVDLLSHSLIGIVGGAKKKGAYEIVKILFTQVAANNCYTDVKIALAYDGTNREEKEAFEMFRWLPHAWSSDKKTRYIADDAAAIADIYYELTQIFRERGENKDQKEGMIPKPIYVLVVSDITTLNNELISKYIFDNPASYGLCTILLVERYEELPNNCEYIIENSHDPGHFNGVYSVRGESFERRSIAYDLVTNESVDSFVRQLSNMEVEEMETGGEIPGAITFFEMMGINKLEELDVLNLWMKNRTYDSMRALLGQKAGGAPCYLDVHEKYHGPHGLIAGTTGSGKSETLQTYMLSLAINYSPDDIGFFIIDYKGGGMANLFSGLPHIMGQISNLSGNQVHRAMVSIKSENRRRQRIFNEFGVNNINSYTKLIKNNEAQIPLPHLFIIIDEFAELKQEEPDFMRELISVAQVGRSLGVHLILATQKPNGTVDDNIWSNSKFRLCLRVQDKQDSNDMLHKPDAAYITQAGRGYLQVGNDELYELFQSGWSGAAYDENNGDGKVEIVKMYTIHGRAAIVGNRLKMRQQEQKKQQWFRRLAEIVEAFFQSDRELPEKLCSKKQYLQQFSVNLCNFLNESGIDYSAGSSNLKRLENLVLLCAETKDKSTDGKVYHIMTEASKRGMKLPETKKRTQLDAVIEYLARTAEENGFKHQFLLWLPVLPRSLYLYELYGYKESGFGKDGWSVPEKWEMKACVGLYDDPANQAQATLELDFGANGHLVVCGMVGTGKSVFLQTLVYSLVHRYSPDYINFYCMDFSSNALRGFEPFPHIGGIMYESDLDKISRCFNMLEGLMKERKTCLKGGNYEQYVQANGVRFPAIFLVIDQYANFREKTGNVYEELLIRISRDGVACGIFLVISAAGFGLTEISNNIGKNIKSVICLEMGDKFQYADVLHTMQISVLPEAGVKGRGLVKKAESILEYHTALAVEAEDDYSRIDRIIEEGKRLNAFWKGKKARPVPSIPKNPRIEDLLGLDEVQELLKTNYTLPIGYNFDNAAPYSLDLRRIFSYLISGKAKSGKTNLLKLLMIMAERKNINAYVIDFSGRLEASARQYHAELIDTDQKLYDTLVNLQPGIIEKNEIKKKMEALGESEDALFAAMERKGLICFFIDDLPDFIQHVNYPKKEVPLMGGFLENITDKGAGLGMYFFSCFTPDGAAKVKGSALYNNLTRKREGVHFGGNVNNQTILNFEYIPYKEQGKNAKPGTAMIPIVEGELSATKVIVPIIGR